MWSATGLTWPGHFSGTTSVVQGGTKNIKMHLENLEGWVILEHDGILGATNGVVTLELEEVTE